ncbi:mitochondrial ribosomal protein L43 [Tachypleus tridentatus]|uniref:mitochondrial ribosomal protein L43 n=1 Tax=Tachypleus tridentatus TaxID=6853 RepID=UPI003FD35D11
MSHRHLFLQSGFIKTNLQNGVGRFVNQLQRVSLIFCKSSGSSKGVREFIETELVDFARANPGTVVYLKPRRHRGTYMCAEYLNGHKDYITCNNFTQDEVRKWLEYLKNKSGFPIIRLRKHWHTDHPSIQGVWNPFTHKPSYLNVATFPVKERSEYKSLMPSATEQLVQIAEQVGFQDNSNTNSTTRNTENGPQPLNMSDEK